MSRPDLSEADRVRLIHMLAAARQALEFSHGRTRESLEREPMFRRAAVHCIQEIGEAASRVTPEGRQASPGLPWKQIVGMRHRVVHAYFNIDLDLVWEVLARDLRPLVTELEQVLGTESA